MGNVLNIFYQSGLPWEENACSEYNTHPNNNEKKKKKMAGDWNRANAKICCKANRYSFHVFLFVCLFVCLF